MAICVLLGVLMIGCAIVVPDGEVKQETEVSRERFILVDKFSDGSLVTEIYVDTETGVEYSYSSHESGLLPFYEKDGSFKIHPDYQDIGESTLNE